MISEKKIFSPLLFHGGLMDSAWESILFHRWDGLWKGSRSTCGGSSFFSMLLFWWFGRFTLGLIEQH
jgi:hypothetical protein